MTGLIAIILALSAVGFPASQETQSIVGPYSAATNCSADLEGEPDYRTGAWGKAGYAICPITFSPPDGYRVRILRVYGDVSFWLRHPGKRDKCAGILWGLQTTAPDGSMRGDYLADNTLTYIQHSTCGDPGRAPFDFDTQVGGLLGPDNKLLGKVAVFLNDTDGPVHIEPTLTIIFRFEKENE